MNRDQLTSRYDAAVRKHWRACMDNSGPTAALTAELAAIAEEHAATVTAAQHLPVAASAGVTTGGGNGSLSDTVTAGGNGSTTVIAAGGASGAHRTRTRTRGGPK